MAVVVCALLFVHDKTSAADMDIAVVATAAPTPPLAHAMETTFARHLEQALNQSTTVVRWHMLDGELNGEPGLDLELVRSGEAQLGLISAPMHPWTLYPQNIGFAVPFSCDNPAAVGKAIDRLNAGTSTLDRAWASLDLIYLGGGFAYGPYLLATTFPVEHIEDLNGKRLSAHELAVDWMWGTGATTLPGDADTFRIGLATGKIDGVLTHAGEIERLDLDRDAPYVTDVGFGSIFEGGVVANRTWFDGLRPTLQNALRTAAQAYGRHLTDELNANRARSVEIMVARGATFTEFGDSERRWWAGQLPDLAGGWAFELDVRNMAGTEMLTGYLADLAGTCGEPLRHWEQVTTP